MTSLSRELVFLILQFLEEEKFKESVHNFLKKDTAHEMAVAAHNSSRRLQISSLAKSMHMLANMEEPIGQILKRTKFMMFYACALDPELCGVKFAISLRDMFESPVSPPITRMSDVAYLASYLSRAKFLSSALVADIIQRWCHSSQVCRMIFRRLLSYSIIQTFSLLHLSRQPT